MGTRVHSFPAFIHVELMTSGLLSTVPTQYSVPGAHSHRFLRTPSLLSIPREKSNLPPIRLFTKIPVFLRALIAIWTFPGSQGRLSKECIDFRVQKLVGGYSLSVSSVLPDDTQQYLWHFVDHSSPQGSISLPELECITQMLLLTSPQPIWNESHLSPTCLPAAVSWPFLSPVQSS